MMMGRGIANEINSCLVFSIPIGAINGAYADTFGSGPNTFVIEFITIGNPGIRRMRIRILRGLCPTSTGSVSTKFPSR